MSRNAVSYGSCKGLVYMGNLFGLYREIAMDLFSWVFGLGILYLVIYYLYLCILLLYCDTIFSMTGILPSQLYVFYNYTFSFFLIQ